MFDISVMVWPLAVVFSVAIISIATVRIVRHVTHHTGPEHMDKVLREIAGIVRVLVPWRRR